MRLYTLAFLLLGACSSTGLTELPMRAGLAPASLPPMKSFQPRAAQDGVARSNKDIARDFLELAFRMESGREIPRLTRFEMPVTVAPAGEVPDWFMADLRALVARLQREAGLDIRLAPVGAEAAIVIETLPRRRLRASVPQAACFVVPRVASWREFRRNRRSGALDWTTLERRQRAAVFIPDDIAPQETRDCLHEEIAQALGPLNDIYRLGDSIFNDDNINTVLTPFDMLILKVYYDPALKNGMRRDEVAAELPAILKRLNPTGETARQDGLEPAPREWIDRIERALGPGTGPGQRLHQARLAVKIARDRGWMDNRLGFALFAQGRLALGVDPALAAESFARAYNVYSELYGTDDIHTAHVALQLAAFALSSGRPEIALRHVTDSIPPALRAENAALLSTLLMIKSEALLAQGRKEEAAAVRLDSLGWARYGFSSDEEVRARLREIAGLRPREKEPEA